MPIIDEQDQPLVSDLPGAWRAGRRATIAGGPPIVQGPGRTLRRVSLAMAPAVAPPVPPVAVAPPFTPEEEATLRAIAGHIVPSDATPGAADTVAPQMVLDIISDRSADQIKGFKARLADVNEKARQMGGDVLARLDPAAAAAVIQHIATDPDFRLFWENTRSLIVLTFYSLPEGYEPIGLPGPNIDEGGFPFPPASP